MKKLLTTLFLTITIFGCSCDSTEPPIVEEQPGRRDYTWTVDTLNYPYNTIYRIWGSSPDDVWATSPGGDLDKTIFHFDGVSWKTDSTVRSFSPNSVFGFAPDNVWMGGSGGKIWRYNGVEWYEFATLVKNGQKNIGINNIWGEAPNDIYAFGAYPDANSYYTNSVIAHFDNSWKMLNTDGIRGVIAHLYRDEVDGKIYLQVPLPGEGINFDSTQIFEYSPETSKLLYRSVWTRGKEAGISLIDGRVHFILGQEVALRNNNQFQTFLTIQNPNFYQRIWGRTNKDIFLLMTDGLVHYNGSNQEYLFYFNKARTQIFGAALFEKEVFFITYESSTNLNLIYHGVLKKGGN
ncbi:MAG: hypothetical protein HND52_02730 [Ignavibacteriae bacterium]|nr:hypothetical protein [Ignavibacteriota bacterium]NOG96866.1 hypothetical protein [Ignavibacteriota bacterium]